MSATLTTLVRCDGADDGFPPFSLTAASNCDLFGAPAFGSRASREDTMSATGDQMFRRLERQRPTTPPDQIGRCRLGAGR